MLYKLGSIQLLQSFSFYGVRSLLILYFTQQLLLKETEALALYGNTMAFLYIAPLLGGWLIDKYWSSSLNLLIGVSLVGLSTLLMALPYESAFFYGLATLIIGQGIFKPTIPYMVDHLYPEANQQRSSAYTTYYMMLNVGSALAPFLLGILKHHYGWQSCFMVCLAVNILAIWGTLQFCNFRENGTSNTLLKILLFIGVSLATGTVITYLLQFPQQVDQFVVYTLPAIGIYLSYLFFTAPNRRDMLMLFLVVSLFGLFVILFEQAGGSIVLFVEKYVDRSIMGVETIPASVFLSLNPFFIITIGFIVSQFSSSLPALTSFKQLSLGFMLIATGFGLFWGGAAGAIDATKVSLGWVIVGFLCHAFAELLIVPVTLSIAAVLAPVGKKGGMIGLWCLAAAYGHYLAAWLARSRLQQTDSITSFQGVFSLTAGIALGCVVILLILGYRGQFNQPRKA
jgi:POT family proton-dependent oligopeptide transporter